MERFIQWSNERELAELRKSQWRGLFSFEIHMEYFDEKCSTNESRTSRGACPSSFSNNLTGPCPTSFLRNRSLLVNLNSREREPWLGTLLWSRTIARYDFLLHRIHRLLRPATSHGTAVFASGTRMSFHHMRTVQGRTCFLLEELRNDTKRAYKA